MIRVYFASHLRHAEKWRCAPASQGVRAFARWHARVLGCGEPDVLELADLWLENEQDVRDADCVIVYAEKDDLMRGCLIEAGMAMAYGVPVLVVGDNPGIGDWIHHPGAQRCESLSEAIMRAVEIGARARSMQRRRG